MIRKLPDHRSARRKRALAWLPVITDDGYYLWLEYYTKIEQYSIYTNMWVLRQRLYEGETDE